MKNLLWHAIFAVSFVMNWHQICTTESYFFVVMYHIFESAHFYNIFTVRTVKLLVRTVYKKVTVHGTILSCAK